MIVPGLDFSGDVDVDEGVIVIKGTPGPVPGSHGFHELLGNTVGSETAVLRHERLEPWDEVRQNRVICTHAPARENVIFYFTAGGICDQIHTCQ